jgi:predicted RNA-binding Zn-ribbon protein involved in translation (DUF1610 family)
MMVGPGYYWFVECSNCRKDIIVREAPSPEEKERPRKRGVRTRCPFCGKQDTYTASTVQRGVVDSSMRA